MLGQAFMQAISAMARRPVLWIPGIFLGLFAFCEVMLEFFGMSFIAGRIWIIGLVLFPLFIAGVLYSVREENSGILPFFREGARRYFRVLLPTLIIVFAAFLTIGLVVGSLFLLGIGADPGILVIPIFGVIVPFIFFTLFYDAVAVWEETRTFESIRRSVEIVLTKPGAVIGFCAVSFIACAGISLILLIVWTGVLYDRLVPVTSWNATQMQEISSESLVSLLGPEGIWITAIILAAGIAILTTFLYTFKGFMYRQLADKTAGIASQGGEFDEKGRWYKY